jgi:hypothetical protein
MTFEEARWTRFAYLVLACLAFVSGVSILFVTAMKIAYAAAEPGGVFAVPIRAVTSEFYYNLFIVRWLWPWMSDASFDGPLGILLCPTVIVGLALIAVTRPLLNNAERLATWMREVKALLAKEGMRASLRSGSSRQSIGDIQAGRNVRISQEITNHYNHRPDNPRSAIIVAVIGAVAAIAGPALSAWLGKRPMTPASCLHPL